MGVSVGIRFLGLMRTHQPSVEEDGFWYIQAAGRTLGEVLGETALTEAEISYFTVVNGIRMKQDYVLQDGDMVNVIDIAAGG